MTDRYSKQWNDDGDGDHDALIIDDTKEAWDEFGYGHGGDLVVLRKKDIDALESGKILAFSDDEYRHFIAFWDGAGES